MSNDLYEIGKLIGIGSFGQVHQCKHKHQGKYYVVKKLKMMELEQKDRQNIQNELKLLQKFRHPNIVSFKDSYTDKDGNLCIVMTYCDAGDMYARIRTTKEKGKNFSETQILDWVAQTALAIHYLHHQKILHRDLKSQNLFLKKDQRIRLGDFGIAKVLDNAQDLTNTCIGTPYYMAPEIFKYRSYSYKCDIWSFGVIIYQLCNMRLPFQAQSYNALALKIMKGSHPSVTPTYSKQLRDLISSMLSVKPHNRPTITDVINKPFIRKRVQKYMNDLLNRNSVVCDKDDVFLDSLRDQAQILKIMLNEEEIIRRYPSSRDFDLSEEKDAFIDHKKKSMMDHEIRSNGERRTTYEHALKAKQMNQQKYIQQENIRRFRLQEDYSMSDEADDEVSIEEEIIREESDEDLTQLTTTNMHFQEEEEAPENYNKSYYKILDQIRVLQHVCETGIGTGKYLRAINAVSTGCSKEGMLQILGEKFIGYWHLLDQLMYSESVLKTLSKE